MSEEDYLKMTADIMKRTEQKFIDRGFAIMHIENSTTGISEFVFNEKGQKLASLVKDFFNIASTAHDAPQGPECAAFVHLLINATSTSNRR